MLPVNKSDRGGSRGGSLLEYARRLLRYRQMDFEYTIWQMAYLCVSPRRVYRTALYHSRTKYQWARDDPAFVVLLLYLLCVAGVAWCIAFGCSKPLQLFSKLLYVAIVDFFAFGVVIATVGWLISNHYLQEGAASSDDRYTAVEHRETVEWRYALDIHCNGFLPIVLLLHVAQFVLLPLLLRDGYMALLLSNALYAAAFSAYHYISFLGYSELPFLCFRRCQVFLYPIALLLPLYALAIPLKLNATLTVAYIYFGYTAGGE